MERDALWSFSIHNLGVIYQLFSLYDVLTICVYYNVCELFFAALWMESLVTVREAIVGMSLAYLAREAADFSSIVVCNPAPLLLPKMWDL